MTSSQTTPPPRGLSAEEMRTVEQRVRRGFVWLASTTILWQACSWVLTLLTARILSPSDYGLLALSEAAFPYLLMLTTLKLETWVVQTDRFDERAQRSILSVVTILGVASAVIAFYSAGLIADFYREPEAKLPFQISSVIFLLRAVQFLPESRLRRDLRFKSIALCNLFTGVGRGVLQLILAYYGFRYWSLVLGSIAREIAVTIWYVAVAGLPRGFGWDKRLNREAVRFGLTATGSGIFWIIFSTADNITVGRLFGREVLGYYAMAFFLAELPLSKLNTVIAPLLSPYFAKLKYNVNALQRAFLRVNQGIVGVVAPILLGMSVVADELVPVLLGEKWIPMIGPLRVMGVVGVLRAIASNSTPLLFALNKPRYVLVWSGLTAIVLPIAFVLFGYSFGLPGVYLAWLVVYPVVGLGSMLFMVNKGAGITPRQYAKNLRAPITSAATMAGACACLPFVFGGAASLHVTLVAKVLFGVFVYVAVLYTGFRRELLESIVAIKKLRK